MTSTNTWPVRIEERYGAPGGICQRDEARQSYDDIIAGIAAVPHQWQAVNTTRYDDPAMGMSGIEITVLFCPGCGIVLSRQENGTWIRARSLIYEMVKTNAPARDVYPSDEAWRDALDRWDAGEDPTDADLVEFPES